MRILAIDTSTHCGGIAVLEGDAVLASLVLNIKKTHSQRLLAHIDFLLKECGREIADMDGIGISIGPGSFTGIRIGMALAKGLCLSSGIPLVGISSLEALAFRNIEGGILICPVMDARRGEIFGAAYKRNEDTRSLIEVLPGRAEPLEKFLSQIREPALFCGDGSIKFRQIIKTALKENAIFSPANRNLPSAVEFAILAGEKLRRGQSDDIATLAPLYLRDHDARKPSPPPLLHEEG